MAELMARVSEPEQQRRWVLPARPVTLGREKTLSDLAVPWDLRISKVHAQLHWQGDRLLVRRLESGRNPIFLHGEPNDDFEVFPGQTFAIGETTFTVVGGLEPVPVPPPAAFRPADFPRPDLDLTCTQAELRQAPDPDALDRLAVLADLPELIRFSPSEEELERRVVDVLLRGIRQAYAAAVIYLDPQQPGPRPEPRVRSPFVRKDIPPSQFRPSRGLILAAVRERRQSVLHRWDLSGEQDAFTASVLFNWALCVPLPEVPLPGWAVYVAGQLHEGSTSGSVSVQARLTADLKFAEVVADIFGALRQVRLLQEERFRTQTALNVARQVQASFFPRILPRIAGYELAACSHSADATGGDYYDVIPLPSGQCGLVVADVCGHGLGPSLLMASLRAMLRGFAVREAPPETLLSDLNRAMYPDLAPGYRFITLVYGTLDAGSHVFRYANAGHGPVALHFQARSGQFRSLTEEAWCPLGILEEPYPAATPVQLEPGDLLVLGSDGLVETRRGGEQFGLDRLQALLTARPEQPLPQVLEEAIAATTAFHESGRPDDDLTLLLVRRT